MNGYITNIEKATVENTAFRQVLYTASNCQLVLMSLLPGEDIGEEVHELDQFIRCEAGSGKAVLDGVEHELRDGMAIIVRAGAMHNIVNGQDSAMKLYTLYSPPNHKDGTVHMTKTDAEVNEEHYDGVTTNN